MIIKEVVAAVALGAFGVFLIWKGVSGDVVLSSTGKSFFPRWVYVLGGLVVLVLPVAYLLALLGWLG